MGTTPLQSCTAGGIEGSLNRDKSTQMKKEIKKEWFLDRFCGQQFAALLEDERLAEYSTESETKKGAVGSIYKGKVTNVLSGMNAAFINCGLSRNCYLCMDEPYTDYTKYDTANGSPKSLSPQTELKEGDEVLVQVTKPARGTKGAKVSTRLSFVGKRLIYTPQTDFLGISRKITDEDVRASLLKTAEKLRSDNTEGFIVRTQAPFATQKQLKTEAEYLKKLYHEMLERAQTAPVGTLLHEDEDLPMRVIRDSFGDEVTAIHVGDESLYNRLLHLAKLRGDIPVRKLIQYKGNRSMMTEFGIAELLKEVMSPTVTLENGGYIVIDPTEAMTVVDVNTGSYVGDKNLEETVFAVNMAAAREIARQVRLRNISGIVVVDFIDMVEETHKEAVTEELKACLAHDKSKCNVLPMSELCLTQFTRKRVGFDTFVSLLKPCHHCSGIGYIHEDIFVVARLRAEIMDCFAEGYTSAIIDLNENIMRKILNEGLFTEELRTCWQDKRVYFIAHKTYKENYFNIRGDNATVLNLPNNAQIVY